MHSSYILYYRRITTLFIIMWFLKITELYCGKFVCIDVSIINHDTGMLVRFWGVTFYLQVCSINHHQKGEDAYCPLTIGSFYLYYTIWTITNKKGTPGINLRSIIASSSTLDLLPALGQSSYTLEHGINSLISMGLGRFLYQASRSAYRLLCESHSSHTFINTCIYRYIFCVCTIYNINDFLFVITRSSSDVHTARDTECVHG